MDWDDDMREFKELKHAFTKTEYIGNAQDKFGQYLRMCCQLYDVEKFTAPCVTVTQSSGFGKSRMIRELALKAKDDEELNMKVMYMCIRNRYSTGYPRATSALPDWLFPRSTTEWDIAKRLKGIFHYAIEHWNAVQTEWMEVFTDRKVGVAVEESLKEALKVAKKPATNSSGKLVVVVIDEARKLLERYVDGIGVFHRALVYANESIGDKGRVFGVLVDTDPRISDPSLLALSSTGNLPGRSSNLASFPPFVLAHTMDAIWLMYCRDVMKTWSSVGEETEKTESGDKNEVDGGEIKIAMEDQVAVYKHVVTGDEEESWNALLHMGRPLWQSTYTGIKSRVIILAAAKLMLGFGLDIKSFNEETMYGVASVLCRVGVHPRLTSEMAPRSVANFMAILSNVNYENSGYMCRYASDPVLTAGAIEVWYYSTLGLAKYLLPEFQKLIASEVLETGGTGETVAQIVLLLAMDTFVINSTGLIQYELVCQFFPVDKFLAVLGVASMKISYEGTFSKKKSPAFDEWMAKWKDWRMGFTHFVQLALEPSEDTLWYLLGRRAAGIFPRDTDGADLFIPIFTKDSSGESKVSLVLVFVSSKVEDSPLEEVPTHDFMDNPLSKIPVSDIIHIYMNVENSERDSFRFIHAAPVADKGGSSCELKDGDEKCGVEEDFVFTLCFGSVCKDTYAFLTEEVAERLTSIVHTSRDPMALVVGDLECRQDYERKWEGIYTTVPPSRYMSREQLERTASDGLICEPRPKKKTAPTSGELHKRTHGDGGAGFNLKRKSSKRS